MKIKLLIFFVAVALCWSLTAQTNQKLLIQTDGSISKRTLQAQINEVSQEVPIELRVLVPDLHWYRLEIKNSKVPAQLSKWLDRQANLVHVISDADIEYRDTEPNDPMYSDQQHLQNLGLPQAWDFSQGGQTALGERICIAIIESGIQIDHEDLTDNIWINTAETPSDGIDNDQNGYIDDYRGPNLSTGNGEHVVNSHGCGVSGLIGATGDNGVGVSGVNWDVDMMILTGAQTIGDVLAGLEYIRQQRLLYEQTNGEEGALVVATNFSAGVSGQRPEDFPMWCEMYDLLGELGILSVCAAPNGNIDINISGDMPSMCTSPYLITVTGSTADDRNAQRGYGVPHIDIYAPSEDLFTTNQDNGFQNFIGNSGATPLVAGTLALIHAIPCSQFAQDYRENPEQAALGIREALFNTGFAIRGEAGRTTSDVVIRPAEAMKLLTADCLDGTEPEDLLLQEVESLQEGGRFRVKTQNENPHRFVIYDLQGRIWYEEKFTESPLVIRTIDIPSDLPWPPNAVYFVTLASDSSEKVLRQVRIY